MSLFVMTRQRYEILCHLLNGPATVGDFSRAVAIAHNSKAVQQSIALRNAGLIQPRGSRSASGVRGPKPILYSLTELGEAAILKTRVSIAAKASAFLDLTDLQVPA